MFSSVKKTLFGSDIIVIYYPWNSKYYSDSFLVVHLHHDHLVTTFELSHILTNEGSVKSCLVVSLA